MAASESNQRILIVLGTRPEAIKLAPVARALEACEACETRVCVTAQHRDLLDPMLDLFARPPDFDLDLMQPGQSLVDLTAAALQGVREVLTAWRPTWTVVQGDTATALAAGLAAFYERTGVAHVEAGLRTGDLGAPWPEEMHRRVLAVLAGLHFAPTPEARDHLLAEGVASSCVHVTGNPGIDSLLQATTRLEQEAGLREEMERRFGFLDAARPWILVTVHRRENLGDGLTGICAALRRLTEQCNVEIICPVHPNPAVREPVHRALAGVSHVHLIEPVSHLASIHLLRRAHVVLTDSGGLQEEAPALGKPVLVLRKTTERPEGVAAGTAALVGTEADAIVAGAKRLLDDPAAYERMARAHNPYGDGRAGERIAEILQNTSPAAAGADQCVQSP